MADAVQPTQRNLYQGDVATYRDGGGIDYYQQLKKLSWPISADMPVHANDASKPELGKYSTLHPMGFMQNREIDEPTFSQAYGNFGLRSDVRAEPHRHEDVAVILFPPGGTRL